MSRRSFDVLIIGGGVIGSAVAFFLAREPGFSGTVAMVERDPSFIRGSTARSVGGIRLQFSTPENIRISQFGARFFREFPEIAAVDGRAPDLAHVEAGYLFLASERGEGVLRSRYEVQRSLGVDVELLEGTDLKRRFPWLRTDDIAAASLGRRDEGWIDPPSLHQGLLGKALSLGVELIVGEVVEAEQTGSRAVAVKLGDGEWIGCGSIVNAAGPAASDVAKLLGIADLPVRSRKRYVYVFECRASLPGCPLVIDPTGAYFRPEGDLFLCGVSPTDDADPDCTDLRIDRRPFLEVVWPALAWRVPEFESLRERRPWAGHYAVNTHDRNTILGWVPEVENVLLACGFSGHGLQQAPAVGRGIAELIAHGEYQSLDLSRFGFERVRRGERVLEEAIV